MTILRVLPCLDSDEMATARQHELGIPRDAARALGKSALEVAHVRVGSTNRQADDALLAEMRRFSQGESFDERPMPELNSEAIDFRAASESFSALRARRPEGGTRIIHRVEHSFARDEETVENTRQRGPRVDGWSRGA